MTKELYIRLIRKILYPLLIVALVVFAFFFISKKFNYIPKNVAKLIVVKDASVDSILPISDSIIQPVVYTNVPNLKHVESKQRTEKFIDLMLPSVLLAQEKMSLKRQKIIETDSLLKNNTGTKEDSLFLESVLKEYKSTTVNEVLTRLHSHPVSIILAQAAIESGWATSRFCREANNVFGIWSYDKNEKRITAYGSRGGKKVYLRKYDSLFESIYDYLETIARADAYRQFREMRLISDDPFRLIWYLNNYSEKRYEYVRALRNMIEYNDFCKYDTCQLANLNVQDEQFSGLLTF